MTENERVLRDIIIDGNGFDYDESIPQSIFEEIQQYRAIGTVEDIKALSSMEIHNFNALQKYRAIGTIEEFKDLKEKTVTQSDIDAFKAYIDDCMDDVAFGNTDWNHSFSLALKCMELHKS